MNKKNVINICLLLAVDEQCWIDNACEGVPECMCVCVCVCVCVPAVQVVPMLMR